MPRLDSPPLIATASATLAVALALCAHPREEAPFALELAQATRSPERVAVAMAEALSEGRRELARALSVDPARRSLLDGWPLSPLPEREIYIEELSRLPEQRAEVLASTTVSRADAGFRERTLRVVARNHREAWYVEQIGWVDDD